LNTFIGVEALNSEVLISSLGIDGSLMVPNQDCMMDVEEFASPRTSRDSRLEQHCEVEHCRAKEELRVLWSAILVFCAE
jgi:hypothetical protein